MKDKIHPKYNTKSKVICACGNNFVTGSTQDELKTELCSVCHPFYTGKQKLVDTARRVEKFQAKIKAKDDTSKTRLGKKAKRAARDEVRAKKEIKMKAGEEEKKTVSKKKTRITKGATTKDKK